MHYTIRPIKVGAFPRFEKSMFLMGVDPGVKIPAPCISWLIEGENGHKILVDTGPHAAECATSCFHNVVERADIERIDMALRAENVDPDEIQTVIFTHLHWDHCYNASFLKNATFYVQKEELLYAIDPIEWHYAHYDVKIADVNPPWFDIYNRLRTVRGDVELFPGISFILLPGHTPGSAGVLVKTKKGMIMLAGDTIPLMANWEGNAKHRRIPTGMVIDMLALNNSFKKIETLSDLVLPGHDYRAFDQKIWG